MMRAPNVFESARFYDAFINWPARLSRELVFLRQHLGPPGDARLLDAGCGTGRHAAAFAELGYAVTGVDASEDMLREAEQRAADQNAQAKFVHADLRHLARSASGPFSGAYCVGNALAALGTTAGVRAVVRQFARVLRPGGRLVIQVLNFAAIRPQISTEGYVRGLQSASIDGREYVTLKVFGTHGDQMTLTRVVLWSEEGQWRSFTRQARLAPVERGELTRWLRHAGFRMVGTFGDYAGDPFDVRTSNDLIVVAERAPRPR